LFAPVAWIIGIPWEDCSKAGELLGIRMVSNEFIAYDRLGQWAAGSDQAPRPRTVLIMTYALSGFANFSSIGIQLGGIGGIAPERRSELAQLGLKAMLGGTLATLMTACVAGLLIAE
jgi:CNT family concentrative nucleoside transporter